MKSASDCIGGFVVLIMMFAFFPPLHVLTCARCQGRSLNSMISTFNEAFACDVSALWIHTCTVCKTVGTCATRFRAQHRRRSVGRAVLRLPDLVKSQS